MLTRRGLIASGTALLFAPSIVRASSLDKVLRGEVLDPLVVMYTPPGTDEKYSQPTPSIYNVVNPGRAFPGSTNADWIKLDARAKVRALSMDIDGKLEPNRYWYVGRMSEVGDDHQRYLTLLKRL